MRHSRYAAPWVLMIGSPVLCVPVDGSHMYQMIMIYRSQLDESVVNSRTELHIYCIAS
jgi:hypothetical protein